MKVLVGITTHNRAEILSQAILSALNQDYPRIEVAVFDDASTDATPLVRKQFPKVFWYRAEANQGYLEARNKLMRETDADLYVSLDDDAWFMRGDEITEAVRLFNSNPEVAAVAFDILSADRDRQEKPSPPFKTNLFIGCGHALRMTAIREVGFYTPNPASYGAEESDLCVRLLDKGYEIYYLPGVHVWHDKSAVGRMSNEQYASAVCNDLAFAFRRYPFPMVIAGVPAKMLRHFGFAARNKLLKCYFNGLSKFLTSLPTLANARKPVSHSAMVEFRRRSRLQPAPLD